MTDLRAVWHNIRASYWFYPAVFSVSAVALALLTIHLDRSGWADWLVGVEWLIPARAEGASNMLIVIAGSMIAVASTLFSITIAAVVFASGNYGPRLLTNFMENRGNQLSLAIFIATFVYSLIVLRAVRQDEGQVALLLGEDATRLPGFVPQLSLLTAFVLAGVSVAVLVYFLNHIPASIRINSVLEGIGHRLLRMIRKRFPEKDCGLEAERPGHGAPIAAHGTGYIQIIDYQALHAIAKKAGGQMVMKVRTGDFIHPDMVVACWTPGPQGEAQPPENRFADCLALGSRRTPNQDVDFLIDELVEIGLRALSPGINDPFTAITAIHWLGAATAEIARRDLRLSGLGGGSSADNCVIPLDDDFDYYVGRGFGALRAGVAGNRIAALRFLSALADAATAVGNSARAARLRRETDLLLEQSRLELRGPELAEVEARHRQVYERLLATELREP